MEAVQKDGEFDGYKITGGGYGHGVGMSQNGAKAMVDAGKTYGIKPIGLGARDTLRLEAALHLYGNDLDENTTPIEAGLAWSVCKTKTEFYLI